MEQNEDRPSWMQEWPTPTLQSPPSGQFVVARGPHGLHGDHLPELFDTSPEEVMMSGNKFNPEAHQLGSQHVLPVNHSTDDLMTDTTFSPSPSSSPNKLSQLRVSADLKGHRSESEVMHGTIQPQEPSLSVSAWRQPEQDNCHLYVCLRVETFLHHNTRYTNVCIPLLYLND